MAASQKRVPQNRKNIPSGSPNQSNSKPKNVIICPICSEEVVDAHGRKKGHDSIFCDGDCQEWLHRQCAGLSKAAFTAVSSSKDSFSCPRCLIVRQSREIADLKLKVESLTSKVNQLQSKLDPLVSTLSGFTTTPPYSLLEPHVDPVDHTASERLPSALLSNLQGASITNKSDKKFNIVIFGVRECPPGTYRSTRLSQDLNSVTSIFSKLSPDISGQSIRDHFRLGKYCSDKCHPILVKFVRSCDVVSLLSSKHRLSDPAISIKPDFSQAERNIHSILLRERRSLLSQGDDSRSIKIRGNSLFLDGSLYGKVQNSIFVRESPTHVQSHEHVQLNVASGLSNGPHNNDDFISPVDNSAALSMPLLCEPNTNIPILANESSVTTDNVNNITSSSPDQSVFQ
jgi:hypothetical protein